MPGVFSKKHRMLLGIDIGASEVKLVELARSGPRYQVEAYAIEPLPANAVVENAILEPEAVGPVVARLLVKARARSRQAAVAVSGSAVITKTLEMPADLSVDELETRLRVDADQYIPYPLDDMALDFQVLGAAPGNPRHVSVLLAACRRESVERLEAVLDLAGLVPAVVDVEAHAWQRAVALLPDLQRCCVAVIDVGASVITLNVLRDGLIVYSREHLFAPQQLPTDLQPCYVQGAPMVALDEWVPSVPGQPFCEVLVQQVSRSLQLYADTGQHPAIEHALLAGVGALINGLEPMLEQYLGISTRLANPFVDMSLAGQVDAAALAGDASALMIACGLALRSFD